MKKAIILLIAIGLIIPGAYYAYDRAKALNISRCLGCLSMEPKATEFDSFWIEYPDDYKKSGLPEHPQWVINETQQSIVFLYFWGPSCIPCEEQWKNMKNEGLVQGEEKGGQITENYSYATLFSLNAPFDEGGDALTVYTPDGSTGTPTTVILFEKNGTIFWYGFSGEANGKGGRPTVPELIEIIEIAKEVRDDL